MVKGKDSTRKKYREDGLCTRCGGALRGSIYKTCRFCRQKKKLWLSRRKSNGR